MYVSTILETKGSDVHTVDPEATLADAAARMTEARIGALVVSDDGARLMGILSERDIVRAIAARGPEALGEPVASFMSRNVITCTPEDTLDMLRAIMTERRFRHLPVVEDGAMVGIISIGDVVKYRIEEIEKEANDMRSMIAGG